MSATINEKIFEAYYKEFKFDFLFLSGKPNFPIESFYLDNSIFKEKSYIEYGTKIINEIVNNTNKKIKDNSGDILFFVTTVNECIQLAEKLEKTIKTAFIMPLYSGFSNALEPFLNEQNKYKEINPNYDRRIFISTNVAESSLTIDGIVFVIDSGMEISVTYDPKKKINVMNRNIIAKAQMSQRKGRSGRTKNGYCFHLYTKEEEDKAVNFPDPEIKKIDIKNVCLSMLKLGEELNKDFTSEETIKMLTEFIEPPQQNFIEDGFGFLLDNGCIEDNKISHIGKLIAASRLDITDGLCLVYAYSINRDVFYKVFNIICIYSLLKKSIDDLFFDDIDIRKKNEIIKNLSRNCDNSEHLLLYNIYKEIEENKNNNKVFNVKLFHDIKRSYESQKHRVHQLYHQFKPLIKTKENVSRELSNKNIILSFNYGFKNYVAKKKGAEKKGGGFVFNKTSCELKSTLKFDNFKSIIFYLNVFVSGKLNLNIISPYILD